MMTTCLDSLGDSMTAISPTWSEEQKQPGVAGVFLGGKHADIDADDARSVSTTASSGSDAMSAYSAVSLQILPPCALLSALALEAPRRSPAPRRPARRDNAKQLAETRCEDIEARGCYHIKREIMEASLRRPDLVLNALFGVYEEADDCDEISPWTGFEDLEKRFVEGPRGFVVKPGKMPKAIACEERPKSTYPVFPSSSTRVSL
eukprot:TRINITY_DN65603_c0_g1_i1.p1 TRINITY_DN65603_c0_g1~~TRINITY_DN65603_c0_g1_i1.p1  ORF type:complete len:205 (-),score=37.82 TRINITY_DN65603_c0_g1_i1:19-633(-)